MGSKWIKRLSIISLVMALAIISFSHFNSQSHAIITAQARTVVTADIQISLEEKDTSPPSEKSKPAWKKIFPKIKPLIKPNTSPKTQETNSKAIRLNKNRNPVINAPQCTEQIIIKLTHNNQTFKYINEKLEPCNHLIAQEFHNRKINASYIEKKLIMNKCLTSGSSYKFAMLFSMPLLERVVDEAIKAIHLEPKDSKLFFKPDADPMFDITKEVAGLKVDEENLYRDIYFSLMASSSIEVKIRTTPILPATTTKDNIMLTELRSKHSTGFAISGENRSHNIKLALQKINGTKLNAGEEFSFNAIVGKRSKERGFKEGNIIVSGKYEKGTGGGVCQVSTTLYNAALLGGMEILTVKNHSLECSYELPSFDAMVSSGQDLKFRNAEKTPIFIRAYAKNGRAVVEIYGEKMQYKLSREYEIVHRKDPPPINRLIDTDYKYHNADAASGEQKVVNYPRGELKTIGYLVYHDLNGNLIRKVKIRQDVYKASEGLLAIAP